MNSSFEVLRTFKSLAKKVGVSDEKIRRVVEATGNILPGKEGTDKALRAIYSSVGNKK